MVEHVYVSLLFSPSHWHKGPFPLQMFQPLVCTKSKNLRAIKTLLIRNYAVLHRLNGTELKYLSELQNLGLVRQKKCD